MSQSPRARLQLDREADRLRAAGAAYAVATVVRTVDATSAKPGGKALLAADGRLLAGWIGGGCARGAVAKAALRAIATGTPQFVSLRPEDLLDAEGVAPGEERAGVRFARNGCPSRGSMDIFVEPVLPSPQLAICGGGPVALALADLSGRFDFRRTLCAPGVPPTDLPEVEEIRDAYAFDTGRGAPAYVVVATQGRDDIAALRAALACGAGLIAFVGSRAKFATLAARLAADGVAQDRLDAVRAPAGLNIHAITPEEIALSILAQIVADRRFGERGLP